MSETKPGSPTDAAAIVNVTSDHDCRCEGAPWCVPHTSASNIWRGDEVRDCHEHDHVDPSPAMFRDEPRAASGSPEPVLDHGADWRNLLRIVEAVTHEYGQSKGPALPAMEMLVRAVALLKDAGEYAALTALPSDRPGSEEREP